MPIMTSPAKDEVRAQIEIYRGWLASLIRRGLDVRDALAAGAANAEAVAIARVWQQDCGVAVNKLSGGSKAHWLARAFSEAFLVRASEGGAVEGVAPAEIVNRLIGVLEQALASLSHDDVPAQLSGSRTPPPHRFDFVHDPGLRPILEQAYTAGKHALDEGHYDLALLTYCGILEAIVTDALQHKGLSALQTADPSPGDVADWSFETRLTVAERTGLIGRGCVRLPAVARAYRDLRDENREKQAKLSVSEREARLTEQVLHVIIRDLNPGR